MQIRVLGGAMSRVAVEATAFAHRDKQVLLSVFDTEWQPEQRMTVASVNRARNVLETSYALHSG